MLYKNKSCVYSKLSVTYTLIVFATLLLLLPTGAYSASVKPDDNITLQIESIDHAHQQFSAHFQKALLKSPIWKSSKYNNIKTLSLSVKEHIKKNNYILSSNLIYNNIALLYENYDRAEIFDLISILLNQNDVQSATGLFKIIREQGDQTLISNVAYRFAVYAFSKNEWKKTLKLLSGTLSDLPDENYHHALLMKGISLQKTHRHRKSIEVYEKIKPSSKYYLSARLNMAIANIRQGWWTDGNSIIQATLKLPNTLKKEESLNRLYLTLGYSLMSREYYRNSRDSFRNIGVNSIFANRALLGITLTAANQRDYVGALNSIRILQNKKTFDLTVDESYLLTPYFYEKLQQPTTASTGYLEAINYYQDRIAGIQSIIDSEIIFQSHPLTIGINTILEIDKNSIPLSLDYPNYIFTNYSKLSDYKKYLTLIGNGSIKSEYDKLKIKYQKTIQIMARKILKKRIRHLNSYMDQSRFGLARLYDNNLIGSQ